MHYSFVYSPRKPFPSACSLAHALHSEAIGITVKSSGNFQGTISCLLCVFFFHCPFVFPSSHCLLDITLYAHTHTCTARTFFGVPVEIGVFDVCSGSRFLFFSPPFYSIDRKSAHTFLLRCSFIYSCAVHVDLFADTRSRIGFFEARPKIE